MRVRLLSYSLAAWLYATTFVPFEAVVATDAGRASAVIVSSHLAPHRDAIGAGVVVAISPPHLLVLTAKHVIDFGPVTVWLDRQPFPADVVRTFAHQDLALVDATVPVPARFGIRAARLGTSPAPGETVSIWGEQEDGLRVVSGSVVALDFTAPDDPTRPAQLSIACDGCRPGDSGAGIFSADGTLVGIFTARYYTPDGRTVALVGEPVDATVLRPPERPSSGELQ